MSFQLLPILDTTNTVSDVINEGFVIGATSTSTVYGACTSKATVFNYKGIVYYVALIVSRSLEARSTDELTHLAYDRNMPTNNYGGYYGYGTYGSYTINQDIPVYSSLSIGVTEAVAFLNGEEKYPITYSSSNSIVSGPSEAAVGDTVTVSAVPDVGYGITDASTQILVTNNDVAVPYTWDAANNRITFTMPDPS